MSHSTISLGLGLGGGKSATSSGSPGGGTPFVNAYSVSFDGVDDYGVGIPGILANTTNYSGSIWFKWPMGWSTPPHYVGLLSSQNGSQIYLYPNGNIFLGRATGAYRGFGHNVTLSGVVTSNEWCHFVWTKERNSDGAGGWNNPTFSYYIDGSLHSTSTSATDAQGVLFDPDIGSETGKCWFGVGYNVSGQTPGIIDEVASWTKKLSATEVGEIYNGGAPTDLTGLAPRNWWRMGDGTEGASGTTVYDMGSSSGTTTDVTLHNGPSYSSDVPS